jgi:pyruvate kinase
MSRIYSADKLKSRVPLTKIVATIGPASENLPELLEVVKAGMRVMNNEHSEC